MILSISILVAVLCIVGLSALLAIALGRAASRGDAELNDRLRRTRDIRGTAINAYDASRQSYAGLDRAQGAIPRVPSTTAPPWGRDAGSDQRARASSLTTRRPRTRLYTPSGSGRP